MKHLIGSVCLATLLLAACTTGHQASPEALQRRAQALSRYGTTIVPGESIGPIRLGMGMDEVQSLLGKPDRTTSNRQGIVDQWHYISMNLSIAFTDTAAPAVRSVWTQVYTTNGVTFGKQTWEDGEPVQTEYKTANGIHLGSTSFDVQRAYGSDYSDPSGVALMMDYDSYGISFRITQSDKRVVVISVSQE